MRVPRHSGVKKKGLDSKVLIVGIVVGSVVILGVMVVTLIVCLKRGGER